MGNVNVTIRMDAELRKEATLLFKDLGLSLNQAVTLFVKQAVREQRIPFAIKRNMPNKTTHEALKEIELMEQGKIPSKAYNSVDELFEDILDETIK